MPKVKNTIPVYDICSLDGHNHINHEIIAEPFASYLQVHPNLHAPHRHSFYHIVLFTKGKGYHTIDFEKFEVNTGQIYFMSPGQVHSWNFTGEVDGYVINFSESLFHDFLANTHYPEQFTFFRSIPQDSVLSLDSTTFTLARTTIEKIIYDLHHQSLLSRELISTFLIELFIFVQRSITTNTIAAIPQQKQLILANFRTLVNKYYAEKRLPKEYASLLYITPNHLNALCKDLLGKPAGEIIRDRILLEAKRLLVNADLSISEIGSKLSFADNSHFTRFFKQYTGTTPEAFRKASLGSHK